MVKANIDFTASLENVLARVWQVNSETLDNTYIRKTREAVIDVRTIYRNKGEKLIGEKIKRYSQSIDFSRKRYRAGYIASFGERHAYLSYRHLKKVETIVPLIIPDPKRGRLTVTLVGAGAALELFGLCFFYNEHKSRIRKLYINCIEGVNDWISDRNTMFERILKNAFPKIQTFPNDISVNLVHDNITFLSQNYDSISESDIILIYNVLNEITANYYKMVWRNLEYILKICNKRVLILLMEPSANYTRPRIDPIFEKLIIYSKTILKSNEEEFKFNTAPLKISYEEQINGLNKRLYKNSSLGPKPTFEKSLKRMHLACYIDPLSPISKFDAERQYRSKHGKEKLIKSNKEEEQYDFTKLDKNFGSQKVLLKYFNEP